jgi:hypothetical protein
VVLCREDADEDTRELSVDMRELMLLIRGNKKLTLETASSTREALRFHPQLCRSVRRTVTTAGAWTLTRVKATCCGGATIARLGADLVLVNIR